MHLTHSDCLCSHHAALPLPCVAGSFPAQEPPAELHVPTSAIEVQDLVVCFIDFLLGLLPHSVHLE